MTNAVRFDGVSFSYPSGVSALNGVSFAVAGGERVAIVGQNGAGKTTLVRHLNGIFQPTEGEVWVGEETTSAKTIAQLSARVGYVFQNPDEQLFARTVRADVEFGPRNLGCPSEEIDSRVKAALAAVGLSELAEVHPHQLSLSERKRVALAGVLAMDTPVVVLDEPTTGQDARGTQLIAQIIARLGDEGRTVVTITHDMDFCAENFARVIVMADGRVVADGEPAEVFRQQAVLESAGVEPPQLLRLAEHLGLAGHPLTVESFVDSYAANAQS